MGEILHMWLRPPYLPPHKPHSVKIVPGVTSPHIAKVTTYFFYFFLRTQKSFHRPRAQAVEPILSGDTSTDAYSRRVVPFGDQKTIFSHLHPQNPQNPIFAHISKIHIRITAWCMKIRCWNLARCLTLPSTLSTHKTFSVRGTAGGSGPHILGHTLYLGN